MTGIVPNDLAHSPITKYKDEPIEHSVSLFALFLLFLNFRFIFPSICSASEGQSWLVSRRGWDQGRSKNRAKLLRSLGRVWQSVTTICRQELDSIWQACSSRARMSLSFDNAA